MLPQARGSYRSIAVKRLVFFEERADTINDGTFSMQWHFSITSPESWELRDKPGTLHSEGCNLAFELGGRKHQLTALRLLEPGVDEAAVSIFFRDATTGRETYPVGRYLEPVPVPGDPDRFILDFNRAYNPTCAFSAYYNCPIPPRQNILQLPVRAGELDPGNH